MTICEKITSARSIKCFETLEDVFNTVHNGRYDYSRAVYSGDNERITIICSKHGEFKQTPGVHKRGNGCPACGTERTAEKHKHNMTQIRAKAGKTNKINSKNRFLIKAKQLYPNYNYEKVEYTDYKTHVTVTCEEHGDFRVTPEQHTAGSICPMCRSKKRWDTNNYIQECNKIHNNYYDYSKTLYKHSHKKVTIICKTHGEFRQIASLHMRGSGCPRCAWDKTNYERYNNTPTTLYYIRIGDYYKIGLTQSNVETRFKYDNIDYEIIKQWYFIDGYMAFKVEQDIKEATTSGTISIDESPIKDGYTEIRRYDFLDEINKHKIIKENNFG